MKTITWTPTSAALPYAGQRVVWFGTHGEQIHGVYESVTKTVVSCGGTVTKNVLESRWLADPDLCSSPPRDQPTPIKYTPTEWRPEDVQL